MLYVHDAQAERTACPPTRKFANKRRAEPEHVPLRTVGDYRETDRILSCDDGRDRERPLRCPTRRAPGAQHASNNVFFGADVLLIPPREASEGWIGEGPRRIRHFRAHEREACVGKGPNRAAEVRSAMTVAVASTYCNVLRAAPGGRRTLDNVSFGAHILVLPSCERAASGAEPTQAASI